MGLPCHRFVRSCAFVTHSQGAEAAARRGLVDLCAREGDAAITASVGGEADQASAEVELVAACGTSSTSAF
jgi:hypothetical protein